MPRFRAAGAMMPTCRRHAYAERLRASCRALAIRHCLLLRDILR